MDNHILNSSQRAPIVSVLIPCHSATYGLRECIESCLEQSAEETMIEVIVANDGSVGEISGLCASLGIKEVKCKELSGSYEARNQAAKQASGAIFAFIDSNKKLLPGWLNALLCTWQNDVIIAGPVEIMRNDHSVSSLIWYQRTFEFPVQYYVENLGFGVTGNLALSAKDFWEIGGFSGSMRSGGDLEFCRRAVNFGKKTIYAPEMKVGCRSRTLKQLLAKQKRTLEGNLLYEQNQGKSIHQSWPAARVIRLLGPPGPGDKIRNPYPSGFKKVLMVIFWRWFFRVVLFFRLAKLRVTGLNPSANWYANE